jgi:hypothetical protein
MSRSPRSMAATSANPHEVDHLRDRVRLFLQVLLVIDMACHLSSLVTPQPEFPAYFWIPRWGETVVLVAGWAFTRFAKPGRGTLIALESTVTLGLGLLYVHLANSVVQLNEAMAGQGPAFALLGILLALVLRASLVPSSVTRTVVLGIATIAYLWVHTTQSLDGADPQIATGLAFMGSSFVLATAVTSHVIYGLRRQMRHALRLGQYELGRKLGEGGMGVVYKATHVMLRRPTAVKLLPIAKVGEQTVARFEREVQQTSRLEHPNSVYIYDYGRTPDGQFYYAMEYLDGVTLEQLVDIDGPINAARATRILRQAASALAEAHAMGLIHRDIKPANIMLCERAKVPDTVKVLDFGLVKAIDNPDVDDNITQENTIVGTPHFLAPEAIAQPDEVGPPSDVYALGAIGFFLVTGREVFTGRSLIEVSSKHLNTPPESPSAVLGSDIDADFEALILRCLAKEPDDRPSDGAALADELEQLDLPGWTLTDARAWWQEHPSTETAAGDRTPSAHTQMAVNVEGRR